MYKWSSNPCGLGSFQFCKNSENNNLKKVNYHFVMGNEQNFSQNCLRNTNKFLSVYSLVKVAAIE